MSEFRLDPEGMRRSARELRAAGDQVVEGTEEVEGHVLSPDAFGACQARAGTGASAAYERLVAVLAARNRLLGNALSDSGAALDDIAEGHRADDEDNAARLRREHEG